MGIHQDTRMTLLRSSKQKLLRWIRQATGFKGEDTQKRCAEGVKWICDEAVDSFEDGAKGWEQARWQMDRRHRTEALLKDVLEGVDGAEERADTYIKNDSWQTKTERNEK